MNTARKVLLVHEDAAQTELTRVQLERAGFDVVTATGAEEALSKAKESPPDAILSDVLMGDFDGFTLCRLLKKEPKLDRIPVVLVSAQFDEPADRELAASVGAEALVAQTPDLREELHALAVGFASPKSPRAESDHDVSAQYARRMASQLCRMRATIAESRVKQRALEAFNGSVTHDLRAPLRRIDGFSAVLLEECGTDLGEEGRDYLARIRKGSQEMARVIDGLRSLAEAQGIRITRTDVDVTALAQEIASDLRSDQPKRNVTFAVQDGLVVWADPTLCRVVLANLLANAWKFTGKNDVSHIQVGAVEREGERMLFVRDNGVGFDPHPGVDVFLPFNRMHSVRDFPGTGVGLATVASVVRRHGGRVSAESAKGKGATIYFTMGADAMTRNL